MPKIYCSNCGNPIQYSDSKPNFCQKCGTNLSNGKSQNIIQTAPQIEIKETRPSLNNLNWEIEIEKPKGMKLRDLAKGEKQNIQFRDNIESTSKEEFLKQFQKEAGTLRRGHQAEDDSSDYDEDDDA